MSGKLMQLNMFPDGAKEALQFDYEQQKEQIVREYSHGLALVQLRYADDIHRLNEEYRTDLRGLDKARWELLTLIATHLDQIDEVRQIMEELARRVDARKSIGQARPGQDQATLPFEGSQGSPDPGPVQDRLDQWMEQVKQWPDTIWQRRNMT